MTTPLKTLLDEAADLCRWFKQPSGYQNADTEVIPKTNRAFALLEQFAALFQTPATAVVDRELLGREVREAWVEWTGQQDNPKPHHLLPYDQISPADQEADCRIADRIANLFYPVLVQLQSELATERMAKEEALQECKGYAFVMERMREQRETAVQALAQFKERKIMVSDGAEVHPVYGSEEAVQTVLNICADNRALNLKLATMENMAPTRSQDHTEA